MYPAHLAESLAAAEDAATTAIDVLAVSWSLVALSVETGAAAPTTITAPITRSASVTRRSMVSAVEYAVRSDTGAGRSRLAGRAQPRRRSRT